MADRSFTYMRKARGVNDHFKVFPSGDQHLEGWVPVGDATKKPKNHVHDAVLQIRKN